MRSDALPDAAVGDRLPATPTAPPADPARVAPRPRPRRRRAGLDTQGRPGGGRGRFPWRRIVWAVIALIGAVVVVLGGLVAYAAMTLPSLSGIGAATGTIRIVDRDGRLLAQVSDTGKQRDWVPINQVAPIMQEAIVAAEDRNFYSEGAFDPARILKALVVDVILQRPAQGASTITEQVAKEAFYGQNATKSVLLKLREALLAQELDGSYSKSQILDMYLNLTYFGQSSYGIEEAAERYFGKPAADLDLSEAALLAGLPQAPSRRRSLCQSRQRLRADALRAHRVGGDRQDQPVRGPGGRPPQPQRDCEPGPPGGHPRRPASRQPPTARPGTELCPVRRG